MNAITPSLAAATEAASLPAAPAIREAGIYDLTHEEYHADPCIIPSLSSSIAKLLIRKTASHAWQAHARFGNVGIVPTRVMDDGSTMHAMLLGQAHLIDPVRAVYGPKHELKGKPVTDYKTAAAQEERDEIRGMGRIPVLAHRLPELLRCKAAAVEQIADTEDGPGFLAPGRNEVCVISREDDVFLRCLVDRLPDDPALPPYDLKCTELSAAPGGWDRRLQTEYAFQDAFYRRVIQGARGVAPEPMRFGVIELDPPHGVVFMAAEADLRALAEIEVERAIQLWRRCISTNTWPGYSKKTAWIGATAWQITQSEDAAEIDATALRDRIGAPATFDAVKALRAA
jgi:hypothetical protein